ncbi:MAG: hypothetical protein NC427_14260 [Ruminococcus flavefaciens]|nr:hypothetical protein [Ruminococcus flavefaciens]
MVDCGLRRMGRIVMWSRAYFTVEAALIFPLATGALILTVFLFIFQYDRCLLEQDVGLLLLYAGTLEMEGSDETALIRRRAAELSQEKYVAWETEELQVQIRNGETEIWGSGKLTFPLPDWNFFVGDNEWEARAFRKSLRLSPADFIRTYRRIREGIENADGICEEP